MQLLLLILGGIVGSAELTVLSGFAAAANPKFSYFFAAGWILVTIPLGALIGSSIIAVLLYSRESTIKFSLFLNAYLLSIIAGFPVALVAPLLVTGAGPSSHQDKYVVFVIEYGTLWGLIIVLLLRQPRRNSPDQ